MPDSNLADASVLTSTFYNTYIREQVIVTCTSATRPTGVAGRRIYETDTLLEYCHDGTNWILTGGNAGWTSYTPTISQGASVDIAKTVTYSKWSRGPRRSITYTFVLALTASGTSGSSVTVTVPVTAAIASSLTAGTATIFDTSTSTRYICAVEFISTSAIGFGHDTSGTSLWGQGPSIALASGDAIRGSITYEAAS